MIIVLCNYCRSELMKLDVVRSPREIAENMINQKTYFCKNCQTRFRFENVNFKIECNNNVINIINNNINNNIYSNYSHSLTSPVIVNIVNNENNIDKSFTKRFENQNVCPECGGNIVFDYVNMLHVCTKCGTVYEDRVVYMPERYKEESLPRTTGSVSSIYPNYGIGSFTLTSDKIEKSIKQALNILEEYPTYIREDCCRLLREYLSKLYKNEHAIAIDEEFRRKKIVKKIPEKKIRRLTLAAIYMIMKRRNMPRPISEIADRHKVNPREIFRGVKEITKLLSEDEISKIIGQYVKIPNVEDYIEMICSKMMVSNIFIKNASSQLIERKQVIEKLIDLSKKIWKNVLNQNVLIASQTQLIAAAIIYISSQIYNYDSKVILEVLSETINLRPQTIRQHSNKLIKYLDIYYYIS